MAPVGKANLRFGDSSVSAEALLSAYSGLLPGRRPWACLSGLHRYLDVSQDCLDIWMLLTRGQIVLFAELALIQGQGLILFSPLCSFQHW